MAADTTVVPSIRDLLDAGLHFGHQTKRWNPKMGRYIFDKRNGIHIIDLSQTVGLVEKAMEFLAGAVASGKQVLFVGTKKQAQQVVRESAEACGQSYVTTRWLGGSLTNSATIRLRVKRLVELDATEKSGGFDKMHKQEASRLRHELEKLRRNLSGIVALDKDPGALVVVDVNREAIAVKEANKLGIPVVAIVDTNCDPDPIDYVIPGNDDSIRGIKLIMNAFVQVIKTAVEEANRRAAAEAKRRAEEEKARRADEARKRAEAERARLAREQADAERKAKETTEAARKSAEAKSKREAARAATAGEAVAEVAAEAEGAAESRQDDGAVAADA